MLWMISICLLFNKMKSVVRADTNHGSRYLFKQNTAATHLDNLIYVDIAFVFNLPVDVKLGCFHKNADLFNQLLLVFYLVPNLS